MKMTGVLFSCFLFCFVCFVFLFICFFVVVVVYTLIFLSTDPENLLK